VEQHRHADGDHVLGVGGRTVINVYEIPPKRARRRAVTREDVEDAGAAAEFTERLLEVIDTDQRVRAAILRLVAGTRRQPRPTVTKRIERGR
jgi:hypothetical protein